MKINYIETKTILNKKTLLQTIKTGDFQMILQAFNPRKVNRIYFEDNITLSNITNLVEYSVKKLANTWITYKVDPFYTDDTQILNTTNTQLLDFDKDQIIMLKLPNFISNKINNTELDVCYLPIFKNVILGKDQNDGNIKSIWMIVLNILNVQNTNGLIQFDLNNNEI